MNTPSTNGGVGSRRIALKVSMTLNATIGPDSATRPPRTIEDDQVAAVIERTLATTPKDATHRSIRSMAKEMGS